MRFLYRCIYLFVVIITARQRSCGKIMFSVVSVHQSFWPWGFPPHHTQTRTEGFWPPHVFKFVQLGPHCTGPTPDTFKVVHYEILTVGKRVVFVIWLKCFLFLIVTYLTPTNGVVKVMFSIVSVCQQRGIPMWPLPGLVKTCSLGNPPSPEH